MKDGSDFGWFGALAVMFSLAIALIMLLILGLIRNFIIYRKKKTAPNNEAIDAHD